jgi:hypothetical protein
VYHRRPVREYRDDTAQSRGSNLLHAPRSAVLIVHLNTLCSRMQAAARVPDADRNMAGHLYV